MGERTLIDKHEVALYLWKHLEYSKGHKNHAYLKGVRDCINIVMEWDEVTDG